MRCRVCAMELREQTPDGHHQEHSPIDRDVCLGCWVFTLELEKFLIRKRDRTMWTLKAEEIVRDMLTRFD